MSQEGLSECLSKRSPRSTELEYDHTVRSVEMRLARSVEERRFQPSVLPCFVEDRKKRKREPVKILDER